MPDRTSCKEAIKKWEERTGQVAAEATEVSLICQIPYIDRMDNSLDTLENVEKLSLSTNSIDKMIPLPKLRKIKILSLGRNNIRRFAGLDEIGQSLEQLWMSYNQIDRLEGLQPCFKLHTFYASNNKISKWEEVSKLANLPALNNLLLVGNPVYGDRSKDENAPLVVKRVPQLEYLDNFSITKAIRKAAEEMD